MTKSYLLLGSLLQNVIEHNYNFFYYYYSIYDVRSGDVSVK